MSGIQKGFLHPLFLQGGTTYPDTRLQPNLAEIDLGIPYAVEQLDTLLGMYLSDYINIPSLG